MIIDRKCFICGSENNLMSQGDYTYICFNCWDKLFKKWGGKKQMSEVKTVFTTLNNLNATIDNLNKSGNKVLNSVIVNGGLIVSYIPKEW